MWNDVGLFVQLDITTQCNARCPQCHRNNDHDLKKVDWLPKLHWTIDDFKKAFPPETLHNLRHLNFCPTWGDPCLVPDLPDMVRYVAETNRHLTISIDTNGSMQTEDWWWDLSNITRNLWVTFAVDGTNQEMHSIYRRNTSLEKVLSNMEVFSNGRSKAKAQMIMFKHNQDYIEEIKDLCVEHGAADFTVIPSNRFDPYNGTGGKEWNNHERNRFYDSYDDEWIDLEKPTKKFKNGKVAKTEHGPEIFSKEKVYCTWGHGNDVTISWDGAVMPCCFINNSYMKSNALDKGHRSKAIQYYSENKKEYNIFNDSIKNILKKPFFTMLQESWSDVNTMPEPCKRHCTKMTNNTQEARLKIIARG